MQHPIHHPLGILPQLLLALPFVIALFVYLSAVIQSNRKHKSWPLTRTLCWTAGVCCASISVIGPLAQQAHNDFTTHMIGHLLLGMIAPLFMAFAAPITILLRTVDVKTARMMTRLLRKNFLRFITDPFVTALFNIGGLWLIYTTSLYSTIQKHVFLHLIIHVHVFIAGYLFTISMIDMDLSPHKRSYLYRSIVLTIALAGHGTLSKFLYSHPPDGITRTDAEIGALLMYYGGDLVDIVMIFMVCLSWYKASRPKGALVSPQAGRTH